MTKFNLTVKIALTVCIVSLILTGCVPDDNDDPPVVPDEKTLWEKSAHADTTSVSFTFWDNRTPPEIPARCAKCHSTEGFIDFLGADGSTEGVVDSPVAVGHGTNNINCLVCHDETDALRKIPSVKFPSGTIIEQANHNATCLNCHQGMRSGADVDRAVADANAGEDEVSENLTFINIHYGVAGAILYGSDVKAGYEYPGETYARKFRHGTTGLNTCISCHNPHSLEVNLDRDCNSCHRSGFEIDKRKPELEKLQADLYRAIQAYALAHTGVAILYVENRHPYFFADLNGDGHADAEYRSWTPRMLKAAYNFHTSKKDKGAYSHNLDYVLQLLQTSLNDVTSVL